MRIAVSIALAFAVSTGHAGQKPADAGRTLTQTHCGAGHGLISGTANPHADAPPFAEVVNRYPPANLEEALAEGIVIGHSDMPEPTFSAGQVVALIA